MMWKTFAINGEEFKIKTYNLTIARLRKQQRFTFFLQIQVIMPLSTCVVFQYVLLIINYIHGELPAYFGCIYIYLNIFQLVPGEFIVFLHLCLTEAFPSTIVLK